MKVLLSNLLGALLFTFAAMSQTQQWSVPIQGSYAPVADGHGTFYIFDENGALQKIRADGSVVWSVSTPIMVEGGTGMWSSGSGVYIYRESINNGHYDSLWYFDSTGVQVWNFGLPFNDYSTGGSVDAQGNFVLPFYTSIGGVYIGNVETIKFRPNGTKVFDVTLKKYDKTPGSEEFWSGAVIGQDGAIWFLRQSDIEVNGKGAASSDYTDQGHENVLAISGTTGAVLVNKNIATVMLGNQKGQSSVNAGFPYMFTAGVSNGKFVIAGSTGSESYNAKTGKDVTSSEWLVSTIDLQGKVSTFKYRGPGKVSKGSSTGDQELNQVQNVTLGGDNQLFIVGTYPPNNSTDQSGNLTQKQVVMALDLSTLKPMWVQDGIGTAFISYYAPSKKVVCQSNNTINNENTTFMSVFDAVTGVQSPSQLVYPAGYVTGNGSGLAGLNFESGYLYDHVYTPGGVYFTKFSIANTGLSRTAPAIKIADAHNVVTTFSLAQNYPNPFNPTTSFSFSVPVTGVVSLKVFDILGQEVATVVNEQLTAGAYTRQWNASGVASGTYIYRLKAGNNTETKKLVLMK